MNLTLSLSDHARKQREYFVERFPFSIGRSQQCDMTLEDRWVSRRHCELCWQDATLIVRDLGSKHGTRLNDRRVTESPVRPGDTLTVGLSTLVAVYDAETVEADATEARLQEAG